jgi:hypothetical protein
MRLDPSPALDRALRVVLPALLILSVWLAWPGGEANPSSEVSHEVR